jgi:hypothetical protein
MSAVKELGEKTTMELLKGLNEFSSDMDWLDSQLDQLRKKYPNKYVAVKDHKVVGASSDLQDLIQNLKKKKLSPNEIPVEFISKVPPRLIL